MGNRRTRVLARGHGHLRAKVPDFLFLAEVYWDLEWTLQQQGFDYTYDKRLYDRLSTATHVRSASTSLRASTSRTVWPASSKTTTSPGPPPRSRRETHRAAAVITFLTPGLRFFHQGQREGKRVRIPVHLGRGPVEVGRRQDLRLLQRTPRMPERPGLPRRRLAAARVPRRLGRERDLGQLRGLHLDRPRPTRRLVAVNYADHQGQCYVTMPWRDLDERTWRLKDRMGPAVYDREGADLARQGLYLDMPAWGYHVFALSLAD